MRQVTLNKTLPMRVLMLDTDQNAIQSIEYRLTYSMTTQVNSEAVDPHLEASKAQNKSYAKVNMFVEQVLDHSFLAQLGNPDIANFEKYNNNIIILPDLGEMTFLAALHCKLNHIVDEHTFVENLSLVDTDQQITYTYNVLDFENDTWIELPSHDEWLPEFSHWDTSWWFRYDCSTFDGMSANQEEHELWQLAKEDENVDALNREALDTVDKMFDDMFEESKEFEGQIVDLKDYKLAKQKKNKGWTPKLV